MDFSPLLLLADTAQPNSLLYSFQQTGIAGRIIVAILLILNLFSFTVLFSKIWTLADSRKRNEEFLRSYRRGESPLDLFLREERFLGSPLWSLYRSACFELNQTLRLSPESQSNPKAKLLPSQMEGVRAALERSFGERVLQLEGRMSILASAVSGAPFLGLLGTVWGVMNTFSAVAASQGNPNLSEMAPGISAALLTTVFALLVAIPAMFGYNFLVNQIRSTIATLENFRAEFLATAERLYVEHQVGGQRAPAQETWNPQREALKTPVSQTQSAANSSAKNAGKEAAEQSAQASLVEHKREAAQEQKSSSPASQKAGNSAAFGLNSGSAQTQKARDSADSSQSRHSPLRDENDVLDDIQQLLASERARQQETRKPNQVHSMPQSPKPADPPIKLPNPGV